MEKLEQYLKEQISFLSAKEHNELVSRLAPPRCRWRGRGRQMASGGG